MSADNLLKFAAPLGAVGLLAAWLVYAWIRRQSDGNETMRGIAELIHSGAMAFLRREYATLVPFIVIVAGLLAWVIGPATAAAYVAGGACSIFAGLFGM